jgi:hypothetical protein
MNFLVEPEFFLAHRNRYSEGMEDRQKTPLGHPDFNSYVKILLYVFWYSRRTDKQTDRQTDREINLVWASLTTFLQVHPLRVGWRNYPLLS